MNDKEIRDQVDINFREIITLIYRKLSFILLFAILSGILCYTYGKENHSLSYTASTKMYILSKNNLKDTIGENSNLTKSILSDYKELIYSKDVLEKVISELDLSIEYKTLASQIFINISSSTSAVIINVKDRNPIMAMQIANTVRDVVGAYIKKTMGVELFDLVEMAYLPNPEIHDNSIRYAVFGVIMAVCLLCIIIVCRYLLDDTIKKPEDIELKMELSVLASIPMNSKKKQKKLKQIEKEDYQYNHKDGINKGEPELVK